MRNVTSSYHVQFPVSAFSNRPVRLELTEFSPQRADFCHPSFFLADDRPWGSAFAAWTLSATSAFLGLNYFGAASADAFNGGGGDCLFVN